MEAITTTDNRPATRRQLWALFAISKKRGQKHDYRNDGLTITQASELIAKFNSATERAEKKDAKLEKEFLDYMTKHFGSVIGTATEAIKHISIVEDDPQCTPADQIKKYLFVGFGCGGSIINFDKRSKIGKKIEELAGKHRKTFQKMFLDEFTPSERANFARLGVRLEALYSQDYEIRRSFKSLIATFMIEKGVKNVQIQSFCD